jgi:hypothetical protein
MRHVGAGPDVVSHALFLTPELGGVCMSPSTACIPAAGPARPEAGRPLLSQVTHHYVLCCGQPAGSIDRIGFEMDVDQIENRPRSLCADDAGRPDPGRGSGASMIVSPAADPDRLERLPRHLSI